MSDSYAARAAEYKRLADDAARRAGELALAVLNGNRSSDVREALRDANREHDAHRRAETLARFRAGESLATFPKVAPWAGF